MTTDSISAAKRTEQPSESRHKANLISAWYLVTGGIAAAAVAISASGAGDPDLFWHRILGGVWLDRLSVRLPAEDPISYTSGRPWLPTAWAMEVIYDRLVAIGGYAAIGAFRLLLTIVLVAILVRYVHRRLSPERSALVLLLVCVPSAFDIQDRPQTMSFVLAALALPTIHRWVQTGELPSVISVAGFTWLWANLHGLWMLVPGLLFVASVAAFRDRTALKSALVRLFASVVAASLTPVGPALLLLPFMVRNSTDMITEWEPTALYLPFTWGFAGSVIVILIGWARRSGQVSVRPILYVLCVISFGMMAYRNVTVSTILLLPAVIDAAATLCPERVSELRLRPVVIYGASALLMLVGSATYLREPVIQHHYPSRIAAELRHTSHPVRVLNDYNISGYLREFGGPHVRLAIDGRADRYGNERIHNYTTMSTGSRGWQRIFDQYDPDVVVIDKNSALRLLLNERGWTTEVIDGEFVLLSNR